MAVCRLSFNNYRLYCISALNGSIFFYTISITECLTKSIYPKLFTIGLMIATVWFVYIQMIPYEEIIGEKQPDLPTLFLECRV
jgi:hypothetical protein